MHTLTVAGMATIPERESTLEMVLDSLKDQVDIIELSLNNYLTIPKWLSKYSNLNPHCNTNEKGDANKVRYATHYSDAYYFSCDDDIVYPSNYVEEYKKNIESEKALITIHGSNINRKVSSYYKGKQMKAHCLNTCNRVQVNIPGSGVSGWHTSLLKVDYDSIQTANMCDIWLGMQAQEQGIRCISIKHEKGWINGGLNKGRATIYEDHKNNDKVQTNLVNNYSWKLL